MRLWIVGSTAILLVLVAAAGIAGIYATYAYHHESRYYIDAVDSAREVQVLLLKQFQSWSRMMLRERDDSQFRKEYHSFSKYAARGTTLLFDVRLLCYDQLELRGEIEALSRKHSMITNEYVALIVRSQDGSLPDRDSLVERAGGKDEELIAAVDRLVEKIKIRSLRRVDEINGSNLMLMLLSLLALLTAGLGFSVVAGRRFLKDRGSLLGKVARGEATLKGALKEKRLSEERTRRLMDASENFVFSMDESFRLISANRAMMRHFSPGESSMGEKSFYDLIHDGGEESGLAANIIREKLHEFTTGAGTIFFSMEMKARYYLEPKMMRVRLERIDIDGVKEIFGTASEETDDAMGRMLTAERRKFRINNSLSAAYDISVRVTKIVGRSMDGGDANLLRIALREIIVNAIEHGNLGIGFEEKSEAMMSHDYLQFISDRRKDPRYCSREVEIDYSLTSDRVVYRVTDQGDGFDHGLMLRDGEDITDGNNLPHGRGIKIAMEVFDRVVYNDKGNSVMLVKYFGKAAGLDRGSVGAGRQGIQDSAIREAV